MDEEKINTAEAAPEPQEKTREEETPAKLEKPPRKPGSVSRFFNQFGVGKYWERLNDYFEHEEKMEKAAAEKEATKETAEGMRAVADSEVGAVKERGAEMPAQIEQVAARAGAASPEAAPIVAEAKAEEAKVEAEAEAAKAALSGEAEALKQEGETKGNFEKFENLPEETREAVNSIRALMEGVGEIDKIYPLVRNFNQKFAKDLSGLCHTVDFRISRSHDFDADIRWYTNGSAEVRWRRLDTGEPPIKTEVKLSEAEAPAAAKADLGEDVEITEQKPLLEEMAEQIKVKYERASLEEVNARIKVLEDQMRAQDARHEEIVRGLQSGKIYSSDKLRTEQGNMKEMAQVIKAERDSLLKVREEKMKKAAEPMTQAEEFVEVAKAYEAGRAKEEKAIKAEEAGEKWLEAGEKASRARGKRVETKLAAMRAKGEKIRATKKAVGKILGKAMAEAAFKIAPPEEGKKPRKKKAA